MVTTKNTHNKILVYTHAGTVYNFIIFIYRWSNQQEAYPAASFSCAIYIDTANAWIHPNLIGNPVDSLHKGPSMRKSYPYHDDTMCISVAISLASYTSLSPSLSLFILSLSHFISPPLSLALTQQPHIWQEPANECISMKVELELGAWYGIWISLFPEELHGHLTRYIKLHIAHAPGRFSPPQTSKETAS